MKIYKTRKDSLSMGILNILPKSAQEYNDKLDRRSNAVKEVIEMIAGTLAFIFILAVILLLMVVLSG